MPDLTTMTPDEIAARLEANAIAQQNDVFRTNGMQGEDVGKWVLTAAIHARGPDFVAACVAAVRAFDQFTEDNDPYGDHSFGRVEIHGEAVWWKIDLYDAAYEYGSDAPAEIAKTRRVLTILFPSDY